MKYEIMVRALWLAEGTGAPISTPPCAYIRLHRDQTAYVHTYMYRRGPMYTLCTPHTVYTSASRSIFSFLSGTSYVRINPYASFNDIPAYHVGILNATEADSSRSSDRPSPPTCNTFIHRETGDLFRLPFAAYRVR